VNAVRIALLVIVGLFFLTLVLRMVPSAKLAERTANDRAARRKRRLDRQERRLLQALQRTPLEAKRRLFEALGRMLQTEERPPE